jgi:hypothetical protein
MRKSFTFLASIFVVIVCLSASVFAQRTTGDIQGTVTDPNGAVVPGASVTITGKNVGFGRTVQADAQGVYRAVQLPPGNYTVSVSAVSGFAAQTKDNVQISANNTTTTDFVMAASTSVSVDVTGEGVLIDTTETRNQTTIGTRQIEELPKGTGFTSLLKISSAVRPEPLGGQYTINGATGPENSFLIDGQETQNYKNGLLNSNNDIPYQAVQEIQVKSSGFEAEYGGATGGVVQAITKSGSNSFHGEFGTMFSTQELNAGPRPVLALTNSTNKAAASSISTTGQYLEYFPQVRDSGTNFYPTASLGGAIIKDKLWFFGIHSPRIINTTRTTHFVQGFGSTRQPRTLSSTLLALGATPDQTVTNKTTYNYTSGRLDAAPFSTLRVWSSYTWNPIVDESPLLGGTFVNGSPGTATLAGVTYQGADLARLQGGRQNSNLFRIEGVWTPTSSLVANARYTRGFQNQKLGSYGIASDPRINCANVPTAFEASAGCVQGFTNIVSNDKITKDVSLRTTWEGNLTYLFNGFGHHELKGGYQRSTILNDVSTGSVFQSGGQGRAYLYYGVGTSGIDCHFTYVQWQIQCPASGTVWALPTLPAGVSVIGSGVNYQFGASGTATDTANSIYVQDKWQPTSRLTFNVGVRLEDEAIPAFNQQHIDLKWGWGDKIAPRIGVSYALTSDGKTKIAGLWGRFFDRLKFALPQGSFGGQFYHVDYFYITSDHPNYSYYSVANLHGSFAWPNGGQCPITLSSPNGYLCDQDYRIASNIPGADVFTNGAVDPNVKPYQQTEMTIEFQREMMRSSVLTVRYLRRVLDHVIEDAGIPTAAGEAYVIGNPGEGLAKQVLDQLGYKTAAVPERKYNAVQAEWDSRYFRNLSFNLNYTWSRLFGNYSGLANPDELGAAGTPRLDPNVSRGFDEPWVGFTASGHTDNGLLPLDRTHIFKASGTYTYDWTKSRTNSTDLSFFTVWESGTPRTTFVNIFGIPIPETKRGDLGRTPMFSQTDLNLSHKIRFGRDNRFTLALDFNALNVFNQDTELAYNQNKTSGYWALAESDVAASGSTVDATNILTSTGVLTQYAAAESTICADAAETICGIGVARNAAFGKPIAWQEPRSIRFGFRFIF